MAKDYAPRRNTAVKQSKVPKWVWIFSTTVILAFASSLFYLSKVDVKKVDNDSVKLKPNAGEQIIEDVANSIKDAVNESDVKKAVETVNEIKEDAQQAKDAFGFYETLKNQEVEVPEAKPLDIEAINAAKKQYVLQAASFKSEQDAKKLQAQFILSGLPEAFVESSGGWHRVFVGPYASEIKLSRAKAVMVNQFNLNPFKKCRINCN